MTTPDPLSHFEVGYDRDYTGAMLHCDLCSDDWFESGHVLDFSLADETLDRIVAKALEHLVEHHPGVG